MLVRSLNAQLIDQKILELNWKRGEAVTRLGLCRATLNKIYAGDNVTNDVIIKIKEGFKRAHVDLSFEDLVVWREVEQAGRPKTPDARLQALDGTKEANGVHTI